MTFIFLASYLKRFHVLCYIAIYKIKRREQVLWWLDVSRLLLLLLQVPANDLNFIAATYYLVYFRFVIINIYFYFVNVFNDCQAPIKIDKWCYKCNKKPKQLENSQLIRKIVNQIFELILEQCVANYYGDNTIVK